ncbi:MAG TPA: hypothetical protein PKC98_19230, partial [Candidatus Melainabacteria bacterium]|nr:hypothetical protein [Candidatus Melainabacteria bacterium]
MNFNDPLWLLLLPSIPLIYWVGRLRRKAIRMSHSGIQTNLRSTSWVGYLQAICLYLGLAALIIALTKPMITIEVEQETIEARDIMLVVDTSDSMKWGMVDPAIADGFEKGDKPS